MYCFNEEEYQKRMEWYVNARFGMFLHWGLYAIPARGEWMRSFEKLTDEEYQRYFDEFNPTDYDPKKWAHMAKQAGMKYMVLTAKHHDGFCLFDSQYTDFKSTNTRCGRDLVREYVDAVRGEGLKVGLYYSLLDWHHEDYPHFSDSAHPMYQNPDYPDVKVNVIPGVTAALSGAALLGAALMHDFAVISLSDLLTPWETIEKRLRAAAEADLVICLYNPSSKKRADYLKKACAIIRAAASPDTVCAYVKQIGREGEEKKIMTLRELAECQVDMFTTVFIGNSQTKRIGDAMVTPRGYRIAGADGSR